MTLPFPETFRLERMIDCRFFPPPRRIPARTTQPLRHDARQLAKRSQVPYLKTKKDTDLALLGGLTPTPRPGSSIPNPSISNLLLVGACKPMGDAGSRSRCVKDAPPRPPFVEPKATQTGKKLQGSTPSSCHYGAFAHPIQQKKHFGKKTSRWLTKHGRFLVIVMPEERRMTPRIGCLKYHRNPHMIRDRTVMDRLLRLTIPPVNATEGTVEDERRFGPCREGRAWTRSMD